jgi:hypothetical protein
MVKKQSANIFLYKLALMTDNFRADRLDRVEIRIKDGVQV